MLAAREAATAARLMAEDEEEDYRFTHDLIGETLEDAVSAGPRRLLHRRIAQTLERERASAKTLAFRFALVDEDEKAIAYLELAGDEARQRVAYSTAVEFFQPAIDRLQSARRPQDTSRIRERLRVALDRIGRCDEAITALEAALEAYRATADADAVDRLSERRRPRADRQPDGGRGAGAGERRL